MPGGNISSLFSSTQCNKKRPLEAASQDADASTSRKKRKMSDVASEAMEGVSDMHSENFSADLSGTGSVPSYPFHRPVRKLPLKQLQNQEIPLEQAVVCRNFAKKILPIYSELTKEALEKAGAASDEKRENFYLKRACRHEDNCAKADRLQRGADLRIMELSQYDHINRPSRR